MGLKNAYTDDMDSTQTIDVEIVRSARRTVSVEIRPDGAVLVRAPYRMSQGQIRTFLDEKRSWIEKHRRLMAARQADRARIPALTAEEMRALAARAKADFSARVARYAPAVGVTVGRITIRSQKTRWGSCSSRGNLNFNCLLMLAPPQVRDYVVVHELCHRRQMNHSPRFWAEVERVMPDYRPWRAWLKENGAALMARAGF